jgi:hypothetical protein
MIMKSKHIALLVAIIALGTAAYLSFSRPAPSDSVENNLSLKTARQAAPTKTGEKPIIAEPVEVAVVEPPPVQSLEERGEAIMAESVNVITVKPEPVLGLEERGEAMLFEVDALHSMPFDHAITMPFE